MAREVIQGSKTRVRVRRFKETSPDVWVDLSGNLSGLDNWSFNEEPREREIPGGGTQVGRQILSYIDTDGSLSTDMNVNTEPMFWGGSGRLYEYEFTVPFSTGTKLFVAKSFTEVNVSAEDAGVVRFSLSLNTDGDLKVSDA